MGCDLILDLSSSDLSSFVVESNLRTVDLVRSLDEETKLDLLNSQWEYLS